MLNFKKEDRDILNKCSDYFKECKLDDLHVVGGAVRDLLLGRDYNDIDLTNLADGQTFIGGLFFACDNNINFNVREKGYVSLFPEGCSNLDFSSGYIEVVSGNLFTEDKSRDFTINSIMYNISENRIVDPNNGIADLRNKIIRTVYDPRYTFQSFPLRMFKMLELSSKTGFDIHEDIVNFIRLNKNYFKYEIKRNTSYFLSQISKAIKEDEDKLLYNIDRMNIMSHIPLRGDFKDMLIRKKMIGEFLDG